jgi:hypothetical protein
MKIKISMISLIILMVFSSSVDASDNTPGDIDLDGDGTIDLVQLLVISCDSPFDPSGYYLSVNDAEIECNLNLKSAKFRTVDIFQGDKYKEIIVTAIYPDNKQSEIVYSYDGQNISEMARFDGSVKEIYNSHVYIGIDKGFWTKTEKYTLNNRSRNLNHVPQDVYYVGLDIVADESFPIYNSIIKKAELAIINPGEKVRILLCKESPKGAFDDWYAIATEDRLLGWAKPSTFEGRYHLRTFEEGLLVNYAKADLDGDGKEEEIEVRHQLEKTTDFPKDIIHELCIDGDRFSEKQYGGAYLFNIIDIDKSDNQREVAVIESYGTDPTLFAYADGKIKKLGKIPGRLIYNDVNRIWRAPKIAWELLISGDGTIITQLEHNLWTRTDKYTFDSKSHELRWIPKTRYEANTEIKILESFPLYKTPEKLVEIGKTLDGSIAKVIACKPYGSPEIHNDPFDMLLIRTSDEIKGWIDSRSTYHKIWKIKPPNPDILCLEEMPINREIDLNGDGTSESIELEPVKPRNGYHGVLKINEHRIDVGDEDEFQVEIIDIDTRDKDKEIAVHYFGPSDDDVFYIYRFTGKELAKIGVLSRWPEFKGNGEVIVNDWKGFWADREKYVLNKQNHELDSIPQDLYYVTQKKVVLESFQLHRSITDETVIATVRPGSVVEILACDEQRDSPERMYIDVFWYLIKTESGLCGWAQEDSFSQELSLGYAD